ncbi:hypothetical protein GGX14DRAFT_473969 [Mycena pura]|uniref:Uncharacterized protein n=1 Tax=Mycena pura TaxID=153505 RepID=A0AAD6UZX7_9AGAR|nr:hypothetical protein GGX14DRAFT_473969 [Mycena pura]
MAEGTDTHGLLADYRNSGLVAIEGDAGRESTRYKSTATGSRATKLLTLYDIEKPPTVAGGALSNVAGLDCREYVQLGTWSHLETKPASRALPGQFLFAVTIEIAPENEDDFNRWYSEEHMAMIARIPGWKRGRRYKLLQTQPQGVTPVATYLALHELDNENFEQTAEIEQARSTEWSKRVFKRVIRRDVRAFELHNFFAKSTVEDDIANIHREARSL